MVCAKTELTSITDGAIFYLRAFYIYIFILCAKTISCIYDLITERCLLDGSYLCGRPVEVCVITATDPFIGMK